MKREYPNPTPEQLAALREYAEMHGRTWKQQLNDDWMSGKDANFRCVGHLLRQVRNTFGPTWLTKFVLEK